MPYALSKKNGYVQLDWSGIITIDALRSMGKELASAMVEQGSAPHVLHLFDQVEGIDFGPWAMFVHSLRREDVKLPNKSKSAQVARNDKARAVCKMFRELNRNPNIEMQVFSSEVTAVAWLRK